MTANEHHTHSQAENDCCWNTEREKSHWIFSKATNRGSLQGSEEEEEAALSTMESAPFSYPSTN